MNEHAETVTGVNGDKATTARPIPPMVALLIGKTCTEEPEFLTFMSDATADGFGLNQTNDHDFTDVEWEDIAMLRLNTLVRAFRMSQR